MFIQHKAKSYSFSTPQGADYTICPNCFSYLESELHKSEWDDCTEQEISKFLSSSNHKWYALAIPLTNEDLPLCMCSSCKYIFGHSHTYQENGCTDSDMFYEYPAEYIASKEVSSLCTIDDLKNFIDSFETKTMRCSCDGVEAGLYAVYPISTHPQYYRKNCKKEWTFDC